MVTVPQTFNVRDEHERARVLAQLLRARETFTPAHRTLYNTLRDECMRIARGAGNEEKVQTIFAELAPYLRDVASAKAVVVDANTVTNTQSGTESSVVAKAEPSQIPQRKPLMVQRRGPDISRAPIADIPKASPLSATVTPPPVVEPKPAVVVPAVEKIPDAPKTVDTVTHDVDVLHKEVEAINDELILLGHGRAFQWLNNPETHYKEYVSDLLSVRTMLQGPSVDIASARSRIDDLKKKAQLVKDVVSHDAELHVPEAPKVTVKEMVSLRVEKEVAPPAVPEPQLVVPKPKTSEALDGQQKTPVRNYGQVSEAEPLDIILKDKKVPSLDEGTIVSAQPQKVEQDPAGEAVPVAPTMKEGVANESGETLETQVAMDPLLSPEVTTGLNDLLVRWLGTSGFLGFGDSGVKHPDWLTMRQMLVEEVLHNDGTIPKGLKAETLANLAENMKSWREAYGLVPIERELVDHFVRRVVSAGLTQKN